MTPNDAEPKAPMAPGTAPPGIPTMAPPVPGAPGYGAAPPLGRTASTAGSLDPRFGAPADFATRAVALILDGFFMGVLSLILAVPFGVLLVVRWETEPGTCRGPNGLEPCDLATDGWLRLFFALIGVYLVALLGVAMLYYVVGVSRRGRTFGGQRMGLRVVSIATGGPPTFRSAFIRYLVRAIIGRFLIGYLWMLWDPRRQTLHDKAADTVVVRT